MYILLLLMIRRQPTSTRTSTRFPSPTLYRSAFPLRNPRCCNPLEHRAEKGELVFRLKRRDAKKAERHFLPLRHAQNRLDPGFRGLLGAGLQEKRDPGSSPG